MAIKKRQKVGIVDFIHPSDDAINTDIDPTTKEPFSDIEEYQKSWDFSKNCVLREGQEATVFKINFDVNHNDMVQMKNASLGGFSKGEETGFKVGSHASQVVKTILVDIVNPDSMPADEKIVFEKHNKRFVSDKVMVELEDLGIVDDLYGFYMTNKADPDLLKKS